MKKLLYRILVVAGVALANGLPAATPAHLGLVFDTVTRTYEMIDEGGAKVKVTCEAFYQDPHPKPNQFRDSVTYIVTIVPEKPQANNTYSLLTVGVQSIDHDIFVTKVEAQDGNGATISGAALVKPDGTQAPGGKPVLVPRTGVAVPDDTAPTAQEVDAVRIWFVSLPKNAAKCILTVEKANGPIYGQRVGHTNWKGPHSGESHDNTPPGEPN